MSSYFITGCSRGLGLAMVTDLVSRPTSEVSLVLATSRTMTHELRDLTEASGDRIVYIALDVTNLDDCRRAADKAEQELGGVGLDILINNAGINPRKTIDEMDDLEEVLGTNLVGVRNVTKSLMSLMKQGETRKVINVSSALGSMGLVPQYTFAPGPAYKISKAALNMMTKQYGRAYAKEGFTFIGVSPGFIRTKMGAPNADLTAQQSAAAVLAWSTRCSIEDTGRFVDIQLPGFSMGDRIKYTGNDLPF